MQTNLNENFGQYHQVFGQSSFKPSPNASQAFLGVLDKVIQKDVLNKVLETEELKKNVFRKVKNINDDELVIKEDSEGDEEKIESTVKKLENKLIKLARLERQLAGL